MHLRRIRGYHAPCYSLGQTYQSRWHLVIWVKLLKYREHTLRCYDPQPCPCAIAERIAQRPEGSVKLLPPRWGEAVARFSTHILKGRVHHNLDRIRKRHLHNSLLAVFDLLTIQMITSRAHTCMLQYSLSEAFWFRELLPTTPPGTTDLRSATRKQCSKDAGTVTDASIIR